MRKILVLVGVLVALGGVAPATASAQCYYPGYYPSSGFYVSYQSHYPRYYHHPYGHAYFHHSHGYPYRHRRWRHR